MASRRQLPGWSIRLLLTADESHALTHPDHLPVNPAVIRLVIGGFDTDDVDDVPFVTLELHATSAEVAEKLAQEMIGTAMSVAGFGRRVYPVAWVAPLRTEGSASSHRFLEEAKDLLRSEQYELAVVAAQIHFESQLRLLLERAAGRAGSRWAKRLVSNRGVAALSNDVSKASVQLLLDFDVTESRHWPEFKAHLERRNAIAHEGLAVGSKEAAASIRVVQTLWASLAEAERSTTLF